MELNYDDMARKIAEIARQKERMRNGIDEIRKDYET
jgi:hypothetical protein